MSGLLLLGIDVGTSATKALVCDERGRVVSSASAEHPISRPRPGWSEQDPRDWWASAVRATREAVGHDGGAVCAVGLSGQMHGSVFLPREAVGSDGRNAQPLRPALLWNDQRTAAQCAQIEAIAGGRAALVELVGNAALTGFTLPKILWVRENEPDVYKKVAAIVLPKDYIRLRMTGRVATDVGDAAGTLLFDVDARRWSERAMALFGVDRSLLPDVVESAAPTGSVTAWAARELGVPAGIPVVGGSGDNQAGAVGAGVVAPGMVLATLGTSGVIYAHSDRPRKDLGTGHAAGRVHTMCAADGTAGAAGRWSVTGCMLSAGGSLQWCRNTLFPGESYDALIAEAAKVRPGCDGLVFLPYLTGERCPHPDPTARGGWIGLTSRHTRAHLIRAVVEGVSYGMADVLDLVRGIGVPVEKCRLGGGGARSEFWRQMLADVFGCPVALTNTEEGPAYGAALLAGVGAGRFWSVVEACGLAISETRELAPQRDAVAAYAPTRSVYSKLYGDLRERFGELAAAEG